MVLCQALLCDCPHSQSDSNVPRVLGVWAGRGSTIWEEAFARQVREAKLWILILSLTVSSGGSEHSLYPWCGFPMAALTNDHKPSGLKNRNVFSHSSGSQKSKLKVLAKPSSLQRFKGRIFLGSIENLAKNHHQRCQPET